LVCAKVQGVRGRPPLHHSQTRLPNGFGANLRERRAYRTCDPRAHRVRFSSVLERDGRPKPPALTRLGPYPRTSVVQALGSNPFRCYPEAVLKERPRRQLADDTRHPGALPFLLLQL
jgi:hypothetical protein